MGQDKGLMPLQNKPMIQYLLDTIKLLELPVHIIANDQYYRSLAFPVFEDIYRHKGPIGGLYTALKYSQSTNVLLLSCDSPFISQDAILTLLQQAEAGKITASVVNQILNPLFAIYPVSMMDNIEYLIREDKLKMSDLILAHPHKKVNMDHFTERDPFEFYNINSPMDVIHCRSKWE